MHELGIASAVLEAVQAEMAKHDDARPTRIGMRIGELAAVNAEALRFAFDVLTRDTPYGGMLLEIEMCPLRYRCGNCGNTFSSKDFSSACPECNSLDTTLAGGDELDLAFLEMENGTGPTGTQSPQ
jgi:hydrogenase nickel incorporation protein HypA/HybF